jgi:hypothetical protein
VRHFTFRGILLKQKYFKLEFTVFLTWREVRTAE